MRHLREGVSRRVACSHARPPPGSCRTEASPPPPSPRMRPARVAPPRRPRRRSSPAATAGPPRRPTRSRRERDELSALWSLYRYTHVQDGRVVAARRGRDHHLRGAGVRDAPRGLGERPRDVRRGLALDEGEPPGPRGPAPRVEVEGAGPRPERRDRRGSGRGARARPRVAPLRRAALPRGGARAPARHLGAGGPRRGRPPLPDRRELGPGRAVPDHPRRLPRALRLRGLRRGGSRPPVEGARAVELRPPPLPLRGARASRSRPEIVFVDPRTGAVLLERPGRGRARRRSATTRSRSSGASRSTRAGSAGAGRRTCASGCCASRARPGARRGGSATAPPRPAGRSRRSTACRYLASVQALAQVEDPALAAEHAGAQRSTRCSSGRSRARRRRTTCTTGSGSAARSSSAWRAATTSRSRSCSCSTGARSASASRSSPLAAGLLLVPARAAARLGPRLPPRALPRPLRPLPRLARDPDAQLRRAARPARQPLPARGGGLRVLDRRAPRGAGRGPRPAPARARAARRRTSRTPRWTSSSPSTPSRSRSSTGRSPRAPRSAGRAKTIHVCDDSHRDGGRAARGRARRPLPARPEAAREGREPQRRARGHLGRARRRVRHRPRARRPRFLERTVPHFRDPRMGVVQTPHHFYNPDVFQRAFGAGAAVPNEADLFNHAIQGGRDGWGGAFFVGSGAVFRREAIASVGGFNLLSITEDIHTSQKLHAKGWRSAFVDEDLAAGLSAESFQGYLVQRRRWMLGCLQIFFRDNPLLERGLPLRHRIGYFASLWYFFFPLARLAFFVDAALVPALPPAPALRGPAGPARLPRPAPRARAARRERARAGLAAAPVGRGLRERGRVPARARDARPRPAEAPRVQGDAEGDHDATGAGSTPRPPR